jgi:CMP-N,N'-diacetyllegionaminic acid synthase
MKILALIPARSGSKRLPQKNIRLLAGKPLIVWTIETALSIPSLCDTLVSTDSLDIQTISSAAGALAPWLRPTDLATDNATSHDVAIHALDLYEREFGKVDGLLLLQPTSPFRTKKYIELGIEKFLNGGGKSVIGVSPVREKPEWMVAIENDLIQKTDNRFISNLKDISSNDLYITNGSFYLARPSTLRKLNSFYSADAIPLICSSRIESIDIDTEEDFEMSELIYNRSAQSSL